MGGSELSAEMQKMVEEHGDAVGIYSADCVLWGAEHKNCAGCQYDLGCSKSVRLMGIMLIPLMYEPKDYDDYVRMNERIQGLLDRTLMAKTPDELKSIPMQ